MEHDKALNDLDSTLERRTSQITEAVSKPNDAAAGSLDSLTMVVRYLGETNKDVVHVLLRSKKDIRDIRELRELLLLYFKCSHRTLEFLNALHEWLHGRKGVSWRVDRLKGAIREFKDDSTNTGYGREVLERAIGVFMEANDDPHVADRLRAKLGTILDEQGRLYERLLARKDAVKLDVYRTVTTAVLASVYVLLMVCVAVTAVLTPAITPAPVVALAAIAAMNPVGQAQTVMNHVWNKYEEKLRRRTEIVNALTKAARTSAITVQDLEGIRLVVQDLQGRIQSFSKAATTVDLKSDHELNATIDDMDKKIDEFSRAIKDLQAKKDECYKDVVGARSMILGTTWGRWFRQLVIMCVCKCN